MDDVRWKQRLSNYSRSVDNLLEGVAVRNPNKLERQGIVKAFELCYELAWKTLQDYLRDLGFEEVVGPKATIRQAFHGGLIQDGERWAAMHEARDRSTHVYNEEQAAQLEHEIRDDYARLLKNLRALLEQKSV